MFVTGQEAITIFLSRVNSFFQDDATGNAYGMHLDDNHIMRMELFTPAYLEHLINDDTMTRVSEYEMIVIDSGNIHGDTWKAVFYPKSKVLTHVQEDVYL